MASRSAQPGTGQDESRLHVIDGVVVYARRTSTVNCRFWMRSTRMSGRSTPSPIASGGRGFGVLRQRIHAGKVFYLFKAIWAGPDEPPDDPFDDDMKLINTLEAGMRSKLIHKEHGEKTFALIFDTGEEAMSGLVEFAKSNSLGASHFTAIGAFQDVTLGYFDWNSKQYQNIPIREQVEVLSLIGDVALKDGEPRSTPMSSSADPTARPAAAT